MRQSAFTVMTPVLPGHDEALSELLDKIGSAVPHESLGLAAMERLHYCSFSLVDIDGGTTTLLFEGNVDGPPEAFLGDLVERAGFALDEIYRHCVGYPAPNVDDRGPGVRYLRDHDHGATTFFVAWPGLTVEQIRRDDELRRVLQCLVDGGAVEGEGDPGAVRARLVEEVGRRPELGWALADEPAHDWARVRAIATVGAGAAALLLGAGITIPVLALAAVRLRIAEWADDRRDRGRDWEAAYAAWSEQLEFVRDREDVVGQNHLASIAAIKPGPFRWLVLRAVLATVSAVATVGPPGSLVGIPSIHFARWTVTPDRQLIFLSNFDGSWESYLGDFVDIAAGGLTAVWTNTDNDVGFPRTSWLVHHGARDEARFKAYARRGMVRTFVWYSAYPELSVVNITNNVAIRRGLRATMDREETQTWLRRL